MVALLQRVLAGAFTALEFHALRFWRHWVTVWVIVGLCLLGSYVLFMAPLSAPSATIVVEEGEPAIRVARELRDAGVIMSQYPLWFIMRVSNGDARLRPGTYRFTEAENVFSVTRRLLTADYGVPSVRLTFPEGITVREMAALVYEALPAISTQAFITLAKPHEGYLFPDTYDFSLTAAAGEIIEAMQENFDNRTQALKKREGEDRFAELVIMASLLEKEARTEESRKLVAGVLYNRLEADMPLQVDAVFGYIFNTDTYSPSAADLKVDSPYNTYTQKGLPPGPINNPGLDALDAATNPTDSKYFYYLTGNDERMYYATTFAGHQANVEKYLR